MVNDKHPYLRTLAVLVILALLVVACAPVTAPAPEQPAPEQPAPAQPAAPVDITFWRTLTGAAGDAQDELVAQFNASQDRVRVTTEFQGNYGNLATALLTAYLGGGGPEVTLLGTFEILEFYKSGVLMDLKPFIDGPNGIDTSDWPGTMLSAGAFDGGIYWLPFNVAVPVLYYNSDAFAAAGISAPPATWDEFFQVARQLTERDASGVVQRYGIAYIPGWFSWALTSAIWSEGGEITDKEYTNVTLNDPAIVDVLSHFQELIREGAAILPDTGDHRSMFMNGQAAMILDSPAPFGDIFATVSAFTPAVANYPAGSAGKVYNPGGGGIAMLSNIAPDKRDAAWEFVKFMLSDESIAYYAERTGYMAFHGGAQAAAGDLLEDQRYAVMHAALPYLKGDFSVNMSPAVRTAFDEAWQTVFVNPNADVKSTLEAANAKAVEGVKDEIFAP